jgi:hypothetical protein
MSEFSSKPEFRPGTTIKKTLEPVVVIGAITVLLRHYADVSPENASAAGLLIFGAIRGLINWIKNRKL